MQVKYWIGKQEFDDWFYITSLGDQQIIFGMPWLKDNNPDIDWKKGIMKFVNWSLDKDRPLQDCMQAFTFIRSFQCGASIEDITDVDNLKPEYWAWGAEFVDQEDTWVWAKVLEQQESLYWRENRCVDIMREDDPRLETTWVHIKQSSSQ